MVSVVEVGVVGILSLIKVLCSTINIVVSCETILADDNNVAGIFENNEVGVVTKAFGIFFFLYFFFKIGLCGYFPFWWLLLLLLHFVDESFCGC